MEGDICMTVFWVFMLLCNLLVPCTMIGFGYRFSKKAQNDINVLFGYRTNRSMKNRDTWVFAHKYFGRIWLGLGITLLPLIFVILLPLYGNDIKTIGSTGMTLCFVQLIPMVIPIIPTESALKKTFDQYGRRIK